MSRRSSRRAELFESEKAELLEALGRCRRAIIAGQTRLKTGSPTYVLGSAVVSAIDTLAALLTGDPAHFHAKPHSTADRSGPERRQD